MHQAGAFFVTRAKSNISQARVLGQGGQEQRVSLYIRSTSAGTPKLTQSTLGAAPINHVGLRFHSAPGFLIGLTGNCA